MKTIELEELVPWMNETPITEKTFIDSGFEREDVSIEESGEDEPFHYYVYEFSDSSGITLMSSDNFSGVTIHGYEHFKVWKTEGELQMLFMLFLKEEANDCLEYDE